MFYTFSAAVNLHEETRTNREYALEAVQKSVHYSRMRNRYFTMTGMYFQTPGSDIENRINIQAALKEIERYFEQGYSDWEEAIEFLNDRFGRSMKAVTEDFRKAVDREDIVLARFHATRIFRRAKGLNL